MNRDHYHWVVAKTIDPKYVRFAIDKMTKAFGLVVVPALLQYCSLERTKPSKDVQAAAGRFLDEWNQILMDLTAEYYTAIAQKRKVPREFQQKVRARFAALQSKSEVFEKLEDLPATSHLSQLNRICAECHALLRMREEKAFD